MSSDDMSESYNCCYYCFHQFPINGSDESSDAAPYIFCSEACQYSYSSDAEDEIEAEPATVDPIIAVLCDLVDLDADQFNPSNSDAWFEYEDFYL
jgi:hypothetical protein